MGVERYLTDVKILTPILTIAYKSVCCKNVLDKLNSFKQVSLFSLIKSASQIL